MQKRWKVRSQSREKQTAREVTFHFVLVYTHLVRIFLQKWKKGRVTVKENALSLLSEEKVQLCASIQFSKESAWRGERHKKYSINRDAERRKACSIQFQTPSNFEKLRTSASLNTSNCWRTWWFIFPSILSLGLPKISIYPTSLFLQSETLSKIKKSTLSNLFEL